MPLKGLNMRIKSHIIWRKIHVYEGDVERERLKKIARVYYGCYFGKLESPIGSSVMSEWGYSVTAEAAGKVALSSRKTSVAVGASKTISLRNA